MRAAKRVEALRKLMAEQQLDACIVRSTTDLMWLTGFERVFDTEQAHTAVVTADSCTIHTDSRYATAMRTAAAAAELITRFFAYYDDISAKPFLEAYRSRSMVTGKNVNVITPRGSYPARVLAVEEDFSLRIRLENGNEELLRSGEVSIRL